MSNAVVDQAIHHFFRSPSVSHYLATRNAILESDDYDPSARQIISLESRVATGHHLLPAELDQFAAAYQICPRWHYLRARSCEQRRDQAGLRDAVQRMKLCLRVITETGDGTKDSPFQIAYLTDADDVVRAFGESVRCQQLVGGPDGYCDVLTSHAGNEFWFDVEMLLERSSQVAALAQLEK